jgi:Ca2+-transporting ATPase
MDVTTASEIPTAPIWHALNNAAVTEELGISPEAGLAGEEAEARLERWGQNVLPESKGRTFFQAFLQQFANFLIMLLLAATILAAAIGEYVDAATVAAIVILSAALGLLQEGRAEKAIKALRAMMAPTARVIRDGHVTEVPAPLLVPGDIVLLEAGNYVPADLRLLSAASLSVNEASLTGESAPVEKDPNLLLPPETGVSDRRNSAFAGTMVTYGRGVGAVVATGAQSEMGRIATLMATFEEGETPLQRRMSGLGRTLGIAAIAVAVLIFAIGMATGAELVDMILTTVSLAVAAVPEGLPAVVTISLALGMQRMAKRNALMRRLAAVETLGSATVIASDKTGTLTKGEMTVVRLYLGPGLGQLDVSGVGFEPEGDFRVDGKSIAPDTDPQLKLMLTTGTLCNDARLQHVDGQWRIVGDTTEGALIVMAAKAGIERDTLEQEWPRQAELPFSSERRRMSTINQRAGVLDLYHKGAVETVLPLCSHFQNGSDVILLEEAKKNEILAANLDLAAEGLRVLALAYRPIDGDYELEELEQELVFLGLAGILDPPRAEAREAVSLCHEAGIQPVMITGDHAATARAVARDLQILGDDGRVLTGAEIERMGDLELRQIVEDVHVYARISPEQKVQIVEALQSRGHIVAVTGDGVNDAPALKRAEIGAAMGITGTDVAKEAADMIITDDNFASIVAAVEEGRKIFTNIRNFVVFLVGANVGEILLMFSAVLVQLPLPLLPAQILWVNLVTDSFPALALSMEPGEPGVMKRAPLPPQEPVVTRSLGWFLGLRGIIEAAVVLAAFLLWLEVFDASDDEARTVALSTIVVAELLMAHASRSIYHTAIGLGILKNMYLWVATFACLALLVLVLYVEPLQGAFHTEPIGPREWLGILAFGCIPFIVIEAFKMTPWRIRPPGPYVRSASSEPAQPHPSAGAL